MPAVPRLDMARNRPRPVSIEPRVERVNNHVLNHDIRPAIAAALIPDEVAGLARAVGPTWVGERRFRAASIAGFSIQR